ncbi:hypothetical protein Ancab_014158 [Ancistrocladus abbreviatus]
MASRSRLRRRRNSENEDRISDLPDDVIGHILSFLATKRAVQTSVLSSRWRSFWTSMTKFDFNKLDHRSLFDEKTNYDEALLCFRAFVDQVIRRCDQSKTTMHGLTLQSVAKLLSPVSMYLDVVPAFALKTLLQQLHLTGAYPGDYEVTEKLLNVHPVLEYLLLVGDMMHDKLLSLKIFVPTLRRLTIRLWVNFGINGHQFMISTPKLQSLEITDENVARYLVSGLPSLDKADIDVGDYHPSNI